MVAGRYICKLGGLNEFDYINKVIEMYDTLTDKWSLVRASPRNILEEIQILEDAHALQISDDEIYIFGGKNSNKYFFHYRDLTLIQALSCSFRKSGKRKRERPR